MPGFRVDGHIIIIEDEKHFMLSCTLYSNMPAYIVFLDTCKETIHNFQYLSTESNFNHVMRSTHHKLIYHLANFVLSIEPCIPNFVLYCVTNRLSGLHCQ